MTQMWPNARAKTFPAQPTPSIISKKVAQMWPSAWAKKSLDPAQLRLSKNSGPGGPAPAKFFSLPIPGLHSQLIHLSKCFQLKIQEKSCTK
jgi:hypothetical protein